MLVIGAGPIGLRMAIECAFLGKCCFVVRNIRVEICNKLK